MLSHPGSGIKYSAASPSQERCQTGIASRKIVARNGTQFMCDFWEELTSKSSKRSTLVECPGGVTLAYTFHGVESRIAIILFVTGSFVDEGDRSTWIVPRAYLSPKPQDQTFLLNAELYDDIIRAHPLPSDMEC